MHLRSFSTPRSSSWLSVGVERKRAEGRRTASSPLAVRHVASRPREDRLQSSAQKAYESFDEVGGRGVCCLRWSARVRWCARALTTANVSVDNGRALRMCRGPWGVGGSPRSLCLGPQGADCAEGCCVSSPRAPGYAIVAHGQANPETSREGNVEIVGFESFLRQLDVFSRAAPPGLARICVRAFD